jgi:hypothetical protein
MEIRIPELSVIKSVTRDARRAQFEEMVTKYSGKIQNQIFNAAKIGDTSIKYDLTHPIDSKEKEQLFIDAMQFIKAKYENAGYTFHICYGESCYKYVFAVEVSW